MKIFTNFKISKKNINSIGVENGKIVGFNISSEEYPQAAAVDLCGGFLLPGFIDTHTHFLHSGLEMTYTDLRAAKNVSDIVELMKLGESPVGTGYDDSLWGISPDRFILDEVSELYPTAVIRTDYHCAAVNSAFLRSVSIPKHIKNEETERGIFREKAFVFFSKILSDKFTDSDREKAFQRVRDIAISKGITTVHALEGGTGWGMKDPEFMLKKQNSSDSGINIVLYPQTVDTEWVKERGLTRQGGCILIDGSIGSRSAALSAPYSDSPGNGSLYFSDRALFSLIERGHLSGFQLAFHAIGDRAISQLVRIYDKVLTKHPKSDHRHRIEHCELPLSSIEKISDLKLHAAVQPVFEYLWGGTSESLYFKRLGNERIMGTNPFKKMTSMGIKLAGGSDFNVTEMNPLLGIHAAVNHPNKNERLSVSSAVSLFTENAAGFSFDEDKIGAVEIGYYADFAVLSTDPSKIESDRIKDIKIRSVFFRGERKL